MLLSIKFLVLNLALVLCQTIPEDQIEKERLLEEKSRELKKQGEAFVMESMQDFRDSFTKRSSQRIFFKQLRVFLKEIIRNNNKLSHDVDTIINLTEKIEKTVKLNFDADVSNELKSLNQAISQYEKHIISTSIPLEYAKSWIKVRMDYVKGDKKKDLLNEIKINLDNSQLYLHGSIGIILREVNQIKECLLSRNKNTDLTPLSAAVNDLKRLVGDKIFIQQFDKGFKLTKLLSSKQPTFISKVANFFSRSSLNGKNKSKKNEH